jgi:hypothetical protein
MYTSIALVALAGVLRVPTVPENPRWLTDYSLAKQQGKNERKPLAVFIGAGQGGYDKLTHEGRLTADARRLLAEKYVCVYLDTTSNYGQKFASAFEVTQASGLVISDRTGDYQAFHYNGTLSNGELARALERFADPNMTVSSTVTSPNQRVSYYPPQPTSFSPLYRPGYNVIPSGGFGGGRSC